MATSVIDIVLVWTTYDPKRPDKFVAWQAEKRPRTLFVAPRYGAFRRGEIVVKVPNDTARLVLALVGRPDCPLSNAEAIEIMWGDDPDGGPDHALNAIEQHVMQARGALAALGFASKRFYGGTWAWKVPTREAAPEPIIHSSQAASRPVAGTKCCVTSEGHS